MGIEQFNKARREYLASISVERQVVSVEDARSPELIEWCAQKLSAGMGWDELRRRLGLGPAHLDARWREIRKHILSQAIPENPQEALIAAFNEETAAMEDLQRHMDEIEVQLNKSDLSKEEQKNQHNFYKYRFDAIRMKMEAAHKKFELFMETKKLAKAQHTGVTIIVQNQIPRPATKEVVAIEHKDVEVDCLKSS